MVTIEFLVENYFKNDPDFFERYLTKLFEDEVAKTIPKFQNALTNYSDDNLTKWIKEVRDERQNIEDQVASVDREIKNLISKYDLNEIAESTIPGGESAMAELQELKAMWINSNSNGVSARRQAEDLNEQLEKQVERNNRILANLSNDV